MSRVLPEVTDAMVDAYLQANDAYWKRTDELPQKPDKWRNGTPREATRESLRAALATLQGLSPAQATPQMESLGPEFTKVLVDHRHSMYEFATPPLAPSVVADRTPEPITFYESDGTERRLIWEHGDRSVGIQSGYTPDDNAWEDHALSAATGPTPTGYVLVPAEPTQEMERAGMNCEGRSTVKMMESPRLIYKAMLSAATGSPATQEPDNPLLIDGVQHDPHCLKVYRGPHKECDCGASTTQTQEPSND